MTGLRLHQRELGAGVPEPLRVYPDPAPDLSDQGGHVEAGVGPGHPHRPRPLPDHGARASDLLAGERLAQGGRGRPQGAPHRGGSPVRLPDQGLQARVRGEHTQGGQVRGKTVSITTRPAVNMTFQ